MHLYNINCILLSVLYWQLFFLELLCISIQTVLLLFCFTIIIQVLQQAHKEITWRSIQTNLQSYSMRQRAAKANTLWYNTVLAILPKEMTPRIGSISVVHIMVSYIWLLFSDITVVWGSMVTSLTLTQVEESLSIWQLSVMKKHFWTLWACLVYLLCLWVALSSVFSPNWILCTHSHRRICISSYTWSIYLPHTHSTFAFMCLLLLRIMTARALPSHLFAFPSQPTQRLRPLLKHQKKHQEEKMRFHPKWK